MSDNFELKLDAFGLGFFEQRLQETLEAQSRAQYTRLIESAIKFLLPYQYLHGGEIRLESSHIEFPAKTRIVWLGNDGKRRGAIIVKMPVPSYEQGEGDEVQST